MWSFFPLQAMQTQIYVRTSSSQGSYWFQKNEHNWPYIYLTSAPTCNDRAKMWTEPISNNPAISVVGVTIPVLWKQAGTCAAHFIWRAGSLNNCWCLIWGVHHHPPFVYYASWSRLEVACSVKLWTQDPRVIGSRFFLRATRQRHKSRNNAGDFQRNRKSSWSKVNPSTLPSF